MAYTTLYGTAACAHAVSASYDIFSSDWEVRWLTDGLASLVGLRTHQWLPILVKIVMSYAMLSCAVSFNSLILYVHTHTNVSAEVYSAVARGLEVVLRLPYFNFKYNYLNCLKNVISCA